MTLFCTAVTGGILILMALTGLRVFESLLGKNDTASYEKTVSSVLAYLDGQNILDYDTINRIADNNFYTISVYDRGTVYSRHHSPKEEALMETACETALEKYNFDIQTPPKPGAIITTLNFSLELDDVSYLITLAPLTRKYGTVCIVIAYQCSQLNQQIWLLRFSMLAIIVIACLLLFLFARIFSARILKPVEESRKKQIQFTAAASHELRSPLAVILSSAETLKAADAGEKDSLYEVIASEGRRMSRLIDDMLSLTAADNQVWPMHPVQVPMDTMLLDLYEAYLPIIHEKGIDSTIELPEDSLPCTVCDRLRMEQVLCILLDNAISYTTRGGRITLGIMQENRTLKIWIANTGPSIPDEQKEQIFDRFFRADTSRKDKQHFGLGLSIAREIMHLHKGKIWVEDSPLGGPVFCLRLPCQPQ